MERVRGARTRTLAWITDHKGTIGRSYANELPRLG
jgi:hypothetical protein